MMVHLDAIYYGASEEYKNICQYMLILENAPTQVAI